MDIEQVRVFALGLHPDVTEQLFAEQWVSWRIAGKWFLLMQLDAPEPRVAVKLPPERGIELRERFSGVLPAYHMNKTHWNDLMLNQLDRLTIEHLITESFNLVATHLPKKLDIQPIPLTDEISD